MAKYEPEKMPEYKLLDLAWEQLLPETENVLVATLLCERQGCGRSFKVDWEKWRAPHLSEVRGYEILGRSCPYCMSTRRVPGGRSEQVQVLRHSQPELRYSGGR